MANTELTRLTPEELKERVEEKLLDAEEAPKNYYTLWISPNLIGFSALNFDFNPVNEAIIVLKQGTNVLSIKIENGKVVGPVPENIYLAYKPHKSVNCRVCIDGQTQYYRIKQHDDFAVEDNATVYVILKHDQSYLFELYFTPEECEFVYRNDEYHQYELDTLYRSHRKFFALPTNFRNPPKNFRTESEEE